MSSLKYLLISLCLLVALSDAKTVFRRTDKYGENLKKVELPAAEIDPNVAPPLPQKIQTIDPVSIFVAATSSPDTTIQGAATAIPMEVVNQDANVITNIVESVTDIIEVTSKPIVETTTTANIEDIQGNLSRYCKCTDSHCDCCREFRLPLLPIVRGPGCARVAFLGNDRMSVSLKYGDLTLASRTISGKRAKPICVGLPGGYSQFCGRVYGLARSQDNFKACLGFELRADDEVEAALRVSCFKFGPSGLRVAESEPLPSEVKDEEDDDDIFGFGAGGDDEDDEEDYDEDNDGDDDDDDDDEADDDDLTPVDPDYGGFSLGNLIDELEEEDDVKPTKVNTDTADLTSAAVAAAETPAAAAQTRQVVLKDDKTPMTMHTADIIQNFTNSTSLAKNKTKRKKSAKDSDTDFAYEILTGILEYFS